MSTIDQQFVEFVIKTIVNNPDDVKVEREVTEKGVDLRLTVNPEDLGRVIGRRGITAESMRTLLRALGTKNEARYNYQIIDNGEGRAKDERTTAKEEKPAEKVDQKSDHKGTLNDDDEDKTAEPVPIEPEPTEAEPQSAEAEPEPKLAEPELELEDDVDDFKEVKVEEEVEDFAAKHRKELKDLDDFDI